MDKFINKAILCVLISALLTTGIAMVNNRYDSADNYVLCDLDCVKVSD